MTPQPILKKIQEAKDKQLKRLSLRESNLTEIPPEVFELKHIEELDLTKNRIKVIPNEIRELKNLKQLDVDDNPIEIIQDIPGLCIDYEQYKKFRPILKKENIHGLFIRSQKDFPEEVLELEDVYLLEIKKMERFPEQILKFKNLNSLQLNECHLTEIPESIGTLKKLANLNLKNNQIKEISKSIVDLKNLTNLNLENNQIKEIPEIIGTLTNLTKLDLDNNRIQEIPGFISKLQNLSQLYLSYNNLKEVPESVGRLKNLTTLNLKKNQLQEISEWIGNLTNLTSLSLDNNEIKQIPEYIGNLTNLTSLSLDNNEIKQIPEYIGKLTNLTSLSLNGNNIKEIPEYISKLINLTSISLGANEINEIPDWIGKLTNLTSLSLGGNQIKEIPECIGNLTNLTSLTLYSNQISEISVHVSKLGKLTRLWLGNNQIKEIPVHFSTLEKLTDLWLYSNQISEIPLHISKLKNLTDLWLSNNQIIEIPESIGNLTNLTSLNLSSNQITKIPESISTLQNLTSLSLSNNQIKEMPDSIGKLLNLTWLELSSNKLTEIPDYIYTLDKLTSLSIGGCQLKEISEQIGNLKNLTQLDLNNNQFVKIPEHIFKLQNLTILKINNNLLADLPESILALKLKKLDLSKNSIKHLPRFLLKMELDIVWKKYNYEDNTNLFENPLVNPMPEIVMRGRKAIEDYFEAYDRGDVQPLNETKLIILGDGAAGKTSLLKRILDQGFDEKESQTQGISIKDWSIETKDKTIRAHTWDFGGQEIMHATHQFFLTERCMYLIVLDSRKDEKTEYWLKHIETYGGNSPVFIVLNKIDENPGFEVDRKFLLEKYKGIRNFFRVSCKENKGIVELKEALQAEINQMNILEMHWPRSWFNIKKELESSKKDYLSHDAYSELCEKEGVGESEQKTLLTFLHDLGVFLHFDSLSLADIYVINPHWITNAVYSIITSKLANDNKGKLNITEISKILDSKKYPINRQMYIVEIMKKFELCFALEEERILIPGLLSETEPEFTFEKSNSLQFVIDYNEFMPSLIIPRFMVRIHTDIHTSWRNGVVLQNDSFKTSALVRFDRFDKKAFIFVNGERKRDYFSNIWKTFTDIHKSFEKLDFKELIPLPGHENSYVEYKDLIDLEYSGEIYYHKHRKKFLVSELLDGIEDKESRLEKNPELKEKMMRGMSDPRLDDFQERELEKDFNSRSVIHQREYNKLSVTPEKTPMKLKILFLSANPSSKNPLNPAEESNSIEACLKLGNNKNKFEMVDKLLDVVGEDIYDILEKHKPNLIHISAHGTKEGILFLDKYKNADPIDADYFCEALSEFKDVELILFSSCNSENVAKEVSKKAKSCIGYSKPIPELAATFFTQKFYEYYFEMQNAQESFIKAKKQLKLNKKYHDKDSCPNPHEIIKLYQNGEEVNA